VRPKSPKMYLIKCCGPTRSCRNLSPKKKPPDWTYLKNNQVEALFFIPYNYCKYNIAVSHQAILVSNITLGKQNYTIVSLHKLLYFAFVKKLIKVEVPFLLVYPYQRPL
jgi:hypothetical protein